ncbi:MAG: phosphoglycerate kinase [Caldisericia bacterium]|nr:phosphoglycerate kinase [Caldisericia bacterium]MDD4614423.1 phosphoglycerate kinase [Caldisericia bacterium]
MKSIRDHYFSNTTVLVRVDMNVPLDKQGNITSESRILAAVPTLNFLLSQKAKLVLITHLGRPKDHEAIFQTEKLALRVGQILGPEVIVKSTQDIVGPSVKKQLQEIPYGGILMLENIRFHPGEVKGDIELARALSELGDTYVNDAFSCCHRDHASVTGIPDFLPSYAGFQLEKEIAELTHLNTDPQSPFVLLQGGAKVSSKLGLLKALLGKLDKLIIGGGMAFTFLKAMGYSVGQSLVEEDKIDVAEGILQLAKKTNTKVVLPTDFVVTDDAHQPTYTATVPLGEIPNDLMGVDIGPKTVQLFVEELSPAATILFNGPMGIFEVPAFNKGTKELYALAGTLKNAYKVAAGGDTAAAIETFGYVNYFTYISMGGGATLAYIEGKQLPGILTLMD